MDPALAVLLCSMGGIFFLTALILKLVSASRKRACTVFTQGTVVDIRVWRRKHRRASYPVYHYQAGNCLCEGMAGYRSGHLPKVGETIPVCYDPKNPHRSYIPGYDDKILSTLTVTFTVIGAIPVLICLGIWLLG